MKNVTKTHYINIKQDGFLSLRLEAYNDFKQMKEFSGRLIEVGAKESAYDTTTYYCKFLSNGENYYIVGERWNNCLLALFNFLNTLDEFRKEIKIVAFPKTKNGKTKTYIKVYYDDKELIWDKHLSLIPKIEKNNDIANDYSFQLLFQNLISEIEQKLRRQRAETHRKMF